MTTSISDGDVCIGSEFHPIATVDWTSVLIPSAQPWPNGKALLSGRRIWQRLWVSDTWFLQFLKQFVLTLIRFESHRYVKFQFPLTRPVLTFAKVS